METKTDWNEDKDGNEEPKKLYIEWEQQKKTEEEKTEDAKSEEKRVCCW